MNIDGRPLKFIILLSLVAITIIIKILYSATTHRPWCDEIDYMESNGKEPDQARKQKIPDGEHHSFVSRTARACVWLYALILVRVNRYTNTKKKL